MVQVSSVAEAAALQLLFLSSSLAAVETAQAGCAMTVDAIADVTGTETTVAVDVAANKHWFAAGGFLHGTLLCN